ncbi:hypothetical protein JCM24511_07075 [Saitozyma sp. JCM 24511]|nr:hypothetical protein JCM24511_07075 [Saitozyma sp. JCM 24511]
MLHASSPGQTPTPTPASSFFTRLHGIQRSASFSDGGDGESGDGSGSQSGGDVRRAATISSSTRTPGQPSRILDSRRDVASLSSFAAAGSTLSSPALSASSNYTPPAASRHPLFAHHASPPVAPIDINVPNALSDPGPSVRSSPASSSGFSPASAFLSHFSLASPEAIAPDALGARVLQYTLGKVVGRGGFSTVRLATHDDGTVLACKIVKRDDLSDRSGSLEKFEDEIKIWKSLPRHPSLLPLLDMHRTPFATFLISPFLPGGSLLDVMRREGGSDRTARKWFPGVVKAVSVMHEGFEGFDGRILHGDLKLDNFLVDHSGAVMVCDFYMAQKLDHPVVPPVPPPLSRRHPSPRPKNEPTFPSASLPYAPPELLRAPPCGPSLAQDIWALGIILYALLTGKLPFVDSFDPRLQVKILRGQWQEPAHLGAEWLECLRGCLCGDREKRWDIQRVRACDAVIGWHEVRTRNKSRSRSRARPTHEYGADPLTGRTPEAFNTPRRSASASRSGTREPRAPRADDLASSLEAVAITRGRTTTRLDVPHNGAPSHRGGSSSRGSRGSSTSRLPPPDAFPPSPTKSRPSRSPTTHMTDSRSRSRTPWEDKFGGTELGVVNEEEGFRGRPGRSRSRGRPLG